MAIIVARPNGNYSKIESGTSVSVKDDGSLIVKSNNHEVAAFSAKTWNRAYLEGDHSIVDATGNAAAGRTE